MPTRLITEINIQPASIHSQVTFSGEMICAETGDTKEYHNISAVIVKRIVGYMHPGDSITVNCDS